MIEPSRGNIENILVITDHFTKCTQAYPTRNQTAIATVNAPKQFVTVLGLPKRLHSDKDASSTRKVTSETYSIKHATTTPYWPQSDGITERFNRVIIDMIGTLESEKKASWKDYLAKLVQMYNSTRHTTTGHSPYQLMFGKEPRLPIDALLNLPSSSMRHTQSS